MVDRLSDVGFPVIEVTNFAHPRVIPHLKDAEEVMARITRKDGVVYRAQAPNPKGAARAVAAKAQEILGLITASETYNLKNQNMTLERGIDAAIATFRIADAAQTPFVMAVGPSRVAHRRAERHSASATALIGDDPSGMRPEKSSLKLLEPVNVMVSATRML